MKTAPFRLLRVALLPALAIMSIVAVLGGARAMRADGAPWPLVLAIPLVFPVLSPLLRRLAARGAKLKRRTAALALFFFGTALRGLLVAGLPNAPVSDFAVYHELARALVAGQGYAMTGPAGLEDIKLYIGGSTELPRTTAFRAPGAALWGFLLGADERLYTAANALLGGGTAALLYLLLADFASAAGLTAGLLWACYPSAVFAANLYGSESLFAFFMTLLAWLVSRRGRWWAAAAGAEAGWCCLIRPPWFAPLAAMAAAWLWAKPMKEGLRRFALGAAFMALTIGPWTLRNWLVFHQLIGISTSQGVWFALHTSFHLPAERTADPEWRAVIAQWRAADEPGRAALGYKMGMRHLRETVAAGPGHVVASLADSIRSGFEVDSDMITWASMRRFELRDNADPLIEYVIGPQAMGRWLLLNHAFYVGLLFLAVWGVCREGSIALLGVDGVRFLASYFLIIFGIYCLIPAEMSRYHFSLMLLVAVFAGFGVSGAGKLSLKSH